MVPIEPFAAEAAKEELPGHPARAAAVRILLALAFAMLTLQLWRLQVVEGRSHRAAAEGNRLRVVSIPPLRGVVYDRNMTPLAVNAPSFVVTVTEADLPGSRRAQVLRDTADILGTSAQEIEQTLQQKVAESSPFTPVAIKENLSREKALALEERSWALPGVNVRVATAREHLDPLAFSHILGYMSLPSAEEYVQRYRAEGYAVDERVGGSGVEQIYEGELHGKPGARLIEADVAGRQLRVIQERPAEPGQGVVLTIDADLQRETARILQDKLEPGTSGVAIVMDPRNGEVLAMVSLPSYDSNAFSLPDRDGEVSSFLSDPGLPLFHRALAGQYPPGSTFKLVTGIGALEERTVTRNTRIDCNGGLRIPNPYNPGASTFLPDWGVMGTLDFVQGLAQSCNVYFYTLGGGFNEIEGLRSDRLGRYARLLGYGQPTGIDLPSEAVGRVPTAEWKQTNFGEAWVPGDTYNMAIGQGFVLATPLQVANLTNGIAMNGSFFRPHVVRSIVDADGRPTRDIGPEIARRVSLRPDSLSAVRDGMAAVLDAPSNRANRMTELKVAGKTGTAEFAGPKDGRGIGPTHGWFTAYAPADRPSVSVTVFLERGGGPSDAVPVATQILREYAARYNP